MATYEFLAEYDGHYVRVKALDQLIAAHDAKDKLERLLGRDVTLYHITVDAGVRV